MKLYLLTLFVVSAVALALVPRYEQQFRVCADGTPIDLIKGYASPLIYDWDGDGVKDLLLGRYTGGNIMIFHNTSSNDTPILTYTGLMQAGGGNLSVPSF